MFLKLNFSFIKDFLGPKRYISIRKGHQKTIQTKFFEKKLMLLI